MVYVLCYSCILRIMKDRSSLTLSVRRSRNGLVATVRIVSAKGVLWRSVPIPGVTLDIIRTALCYSVVGVEGVKEVQGVLG
jgi:hypothetical protein